MLNILCQEFGRTIDDVRSKSRKAEDVMCRRLYCKALKENTLLSPGTIGSTIDMTEDGVRRAVWDYDNLILDRRKEAHYNRILNLFKEQYIPKNSFANES